jgi:hypothetical protein
MGHFTEGLARTRAAVQGLAGRRDRTPAALVKRFGAVQAQDYAYALWSVAQRLAHDVAVVERALAGGAILRTHVLRPTWHVVPRDDLRWMQALTSPRVIARMGPIDRRNGVDAALVARSTRAIAAAIAKRGHLTRREIAEVLSRVSVPAGAWIVSELLIHAELRAVVCSGVPRGRQQTYALVEERAPRSIRLGRDDALATLAERYFQSHGPATVKDFRWWSGLDAASAARGVAALGRGFDRIRHGDRLYLAPAASPRPRPLAAHLVQPFDEIVVAYRESRDVVDPAGLAGGRAGALLLRGVLVDGRLAGRWTPAAPGAREIRVEPLRTLTTRERTAVDRARARLEAAFSIRGS